VVVKSMTEALVSTRLALRLVDNGTHGGQLGRVPGAAAGAAAGALCHRALGGGAFPAVAPAAFGAPERRALVAYNAALVGLLSATADGVASVLDARVVERASVLSQSVVCEGLETDQETDDSDSDSDSDTDDEYFMTDTDDIISPKAGDAASTAVATYLATALRGVVLAAGPCGEAEGTGEGDYGELLRAARRALSRPTLSGQNTQIAKKALRSRNDLVQAVGEVWSAAVISGPSERRAACVSLLAAVLPNAAAAATSSSSDGSASGISAPPVAFSSAFLAEDAAAKWLRPFARALWELKHKDPNTTHRALLALRTVAARATPDRLPHTHAALVAVESELAPFFALASISHFHIPPP
jgi:pre-rRNA-processing protein IPI1